jgi:hypothetical protein
LLEGRVSREHFNEFFPLRAHHRHFGLKDVVAIASLRVGFLAARPLEEQVRV